MNLYVDEMRMLLMIWLCDFGTIDVDCHPWWIKRIAMTIEMVWIVTIYEKCVWPICCIDMKWKWLPEGVDCHPWWKAWFDMINGNMYDECMMTTWK